MKIILKTFLLTISSIFIFLIYLTFVGIETSKFNSQISNKIKKIDKDLDLNLKSIKIILNPFKFKIYAKTIGPKLKAKDKIIEIENIQTQISLLSIINNEFSLEDLEASTKTIEIKNLVSFLRQFYNTPQLYILEKFIKRGHLIANIKVYFDKEGKIKNNFKVKGLIKDSQVGITKDYNIEKINLIFDLNNESLKAQDITFKFNDLNFSSEKVFVKKNKEQFIIDGQVQNKNFELDKKKLSFFLKNNFPNLEINKLKFSSNNNFSFQIDKKLRIRDLKVISDVKIDNIYINNNFKLKNIFPNIKEVFNFSNQKLKIDYTKNQLSIEGKGDILFQEKKDNINYFILKKGDEYEFQSSLNIKDNPLILEKLNYKNLSGEKTQINTKGVYNSNKEIIINSLSLKEKNNEFLIKNLELNKKFQIIDLEHVKFNYFDEDDYRNLIELKNKKNNYYLIGEALNIDKLIKILLSDDDNNNLDIFNKKFNLNIDIKEVRLDNEHIIENFIGDLSFNKQKISSANLLGSFSNEQKLKFTINSTPSGKVTTLFMDKAKPIVNRYRFIKGFENGSLDFNSTQNEMETISTLKIYDFKLKELPTLTKILTLASLQGIADILSGEGIGFDEFEMNFKSKDNLITIDEIYAIGPAISILMNGYIEKNKLVSLRGSLVPATTINKAIGSIPILGEILVGSKTGEGVFGVSFKIKGPPKNLETTVNPIKTLTPRFITRTLERIKKN